MCFVLISALAIVATSFANSIDAPVVDLAVRDDSNYQTKAQMINSTRYYIEYPVGGTGGDPFAGPSFYDLVEWVQKPEAPSITSITVRGARRVDQISYSVVFPNGTQTTYSFGGHGGQEATMQLVEGEVIIGIMVQPGGYVSRRSTFWRRFLFFGKKKKPSAGQEDGQAKVAEDPKYAPNPEVNQPRAADDGAIGNDGPLGEGVKDPISGQNLPEGDIQMAEALKSDAGDAATKVEIAASTGSQAEKALIATTEGFWKKAYRISSPWLMAGSIAVIVGQPLTNLAIQTYKKKHHGSLRIHFIRITTNMGRSLSQGTPNNNQPVTYLIPANYTKLVGFVGRSAREVDAIAPVWWKEMAPVGIANGTLDNVP